MYIKGVGERRKQLLEKLDVTDFFSLISFYPRTYLDFSNPSKICDLKIDETCCFSAIIGTSIVETAVKKGMTLYKTTAFDETGVVHITIFNSKWQAQSLVEGEKYYFLGKVNKKGSKLEMSSPIIEKADTPYLLTPIYQQTSGLSSKVIHQIISNALKIYSELQFEDTLPKKIRQEYKLCHEFYALTNIHHPKNDIELEIAKRRLIFEELFILLAGIQKLKIQKKKITNYIIKKDYCNEFSSLLPFEMTNAQKRAIADCIGDMSSNCPMNRLVHGDVGSGKTVVAASLIYTASKNKMQSALLAPTEILATQHFQTLSKLFENSEIKFELLTGSTTAANKRRIKKALKDGELDFVVGTHALFTLDVEFKNLALVITDEQHRFGVKQRNSLTQKGDNAHILVMSATPIPRTLSLIIYGDLDLSIIDELPKGRQKIHTYAVNSSYHQRLYTFVKKYLDEGRQAYIVCPLVEEGEGESELVSANEYAQSLSQEYFQDYKIAVLHGKMKPKQKDKIMTSFACGEIDLLVSTTVIEVGVDVPNSNIMIIENAERFGLSQLHQLRGRVGRAEHQSYCVLVSDAKNETSVSRLKVMCSTTDGFKIADEDLKLRGPGDFFGSRQHGLPQLKIASLMDNMEILTQCRAAAQKLFKSDPLLQKPENKAISTKIDRLFEQVNGQLN